MIEDISAAELSALIGSIYDRVLDPSGWNETLDQLRAVMRCETALLHLSDVRKHSALFQAVSGISPEWLAQVHSNVPEIHQELAKHLNWMRSIDDPYIVSRHYPTCWDRSRYAKECLSPNKIVDVLQYCLMFSTSRYAGIAVGRHEKYGIITAREIEIGALIIPHIRRAVMISDVLEIRMIEAARMSEALDGLSCGVVLAEQSGKIVHANAAAERMLDAGDLIASRGRMLQAVYPPASRQLRATLQAVLGEGTEIGQAAQPIRLTPHDTSPVFAHVMPLSRNNLGRIHATELAGIFISGTNADDDAADAVAAIFGLTPAETMVLRSLASGRTLAETAAALGVATATAKTHLDRIFLKTEVNRQADLMRLLARVAPPVYG